MPVESGEMSTWYLNSRSTQVWIEVPNNGDHVNGIGIDWELDDTFNYSPGQYEDAFGRVGINVDSRPDEQFPARWVWHNVNGRKLELMILQNKVWQIQIHLAGN